VGCISNEAFTWFGNKFSLFDFELTKKVNLVKRSIMVVVFCLIQLLKITLMREHRKLLFQDQIMKRIRKPWLLSFVFVGLFLNHGY
jgi:hypothetical protein